MKKQDSLFSLFLSKLNKEGNQPETEKIFFYLVLFISFFTVVFIYLRADAPYDTGDGIVHYQIARYSWKYPHLLLDLWGKPFFTLISSPFAQFGLKGMYVFQAFNSAVISWFLFSIAKKIKLKYAWTIPAFVFFAPVYFAVMNSGLVEIFFGTMFMFSAWLVFEKKYYASALVASLIPFVRPEAYVVIPLLIAIYIYRQKYFAIPLLLAAAVFYTLVGYPHYKDIWWIITQNYRLVGDNYAGMKGSYFHYFGIYDQIWGTAYTVLLLLGSGTVIYQLIRLFRHKPVHEFVEEVFVVFLGSALGCFVLHSLLCGMPGILNNLGMLRYVAVLIPSSALIALIGLNMINLPAFTRISFLKPVIVLAVLYLIVTSSFAQWYYPFKPYNEQYVMKQMVNYIQADWPAFKKIYFIHPSLTVFGNLDPYDNTRLEMVRSGDQGYLNNLPDSTLILWDSHFMKGEGKIPINWLSENSNFRMLKHYKFSNEELPFETFLFLRTNIASELSAAIPVELVYPACLDPRLLTEDSTLVDFQSDPSAFQKWTLLQTSVSGQNAMEFKPESEYGPAYFKKISSLHLRGNLKSVTLRFNLLQNDTLKDVIGVVEIKDHDKQIAWEGMVMKQALRSGQWNSQVLHHSYPEPLTDSDFDVNIYIWNKGKKKFYIKDFKIIFGSITG